MRLIRKRKRQTKVFVTNNMGHTEPKCLLCDQPELLLPVTRYTPRHAKQKGKARCV